MCSPEQPRITGFSALIQTIAATLEIAERELPAHEFDELALLISGKIDRLRHGVDQ